MGKGVRWPLKCDSKATHKVPNNIILSTSLYYTSHLALPVSRVTIVRQVPPYIYIYISQTIFDGLCELDH